ncbi:MAG TPA: hypothetical protein VM012_09305, partial [Flavitalea sp.]|nr:hypothetical protein [Flavitalea sp.]
MKKYSLFLVIVLSILSTVLQAQDEEQKAGGFDKSKLFFGGNFGLSFGTFTLINVSPQVGYRFNKTLAAGAGINFQYSSFKNRYTNPIYDYRDNFGVAGLNIFGRVYPIEYVLLQIQPEMN